MNKIVITHTDREGTWRPYLEISSNEQIRLYIPKGWKITHEHREKLCPK